MLKKVFVCTGLLFLILATSVHAQLAVRYKCAEQVAESPMIKPVINIINKGDTAVELRNIILRYYYTKEGISNQRYQIDYASVGASNVEIKFEYGYLEISFPNVNMIIPPKGETGEIQIRIFKEDWSNYDQNDDYSFEPLMTAYMDMNRITLFYSGKLVWGAEFEVQPSPPPRDK